MRIGLTSFVVFFSKVLANVLGFVATLYFARVLGAEILGYYAIVLALVAWLGLVGELGVGHAITKRISEGTDQSAYFTAGLIIMTSLGIVVSLLVVFFRDVINDYVGVPVAVFVILLLLASQLKGIVFSALRGEHLVHIAGVLTPVRIGARSLFQIALVFLGFELAGMLFGYALGAIVVGFVGLGFVSVKLVRPTKRHFKHLFNFAKYSWIGNLKTRSFHEVDVIVLGALVPSALVGVYSVAWSIATFLALFGDAVGSTLFPELSSADSAGRQRLVESLVMGSITYGGLIAIPGLFGGLVLGDRLLRIYGDEFTKGTAVLAILIFATLIYGYQKQLLNTINAMDRPDLAFRINALFIVINVVLNIGLILWMGWIGAAIATLISALAGTVLSFLLLKQLVNFKVPMGQIGRQVLAAGVMAAVVYTTRYALETTALARHNAGFVVFLVTMGVVVYFLTLLAISREFRSVVSKNSPIRIPFLL